MMNTRNYYWTEEEEQTLRAYYHSTNAAKLAFMLGKTAPAIYRKASDLGLKKVVRKPRKAKTTSPMEKVEAPVSIYGEQADGSYRCRLGWVFSAEDCQREREVCRETEEWFNNKFGGKKRTTAPAPVEHVVKLKSEELSRANIIGLYMVPSQDITVAVRMGRLPYHRRKGSNGYWFWSHDVERWVEERRKSRVI